MPVTTNPGVPKVIYGGGISSPRLFADSGLKAITGLFFFSNYYDPIE